MLTKWWRQCRCDWMDFPLRQGTVWAGRYRIDQFIGMGSYGQTYRCTDLMTRTSVLMKRAKPSKQRIARMMLEQESDILRRFDHPQIPKWLNYTENRNEEVLITELVEGDSLVYSIIEQGRTYSEREALLIIQQLLRPILHMHETGYVHRDVSIGNVLAHRDRIYLIDFGLACRIGKAPMSEEHDDIDNSRGLSGFVDSWGPVKERMRVPDPTSDLYGLGHLFLFLIYTGYSPNEGQEELSWEEELKLNPDVEAFVQSLLAGNLRTAAECERELEDVLTSIGMAD
ncbi:serine/threonine-protein kinase [Paenibacillus taihuensis]|uniref:Serine/threonine-protein kinase n=1 Tax=Paenibacillus taihuensis TaxID=1156355 RepID=A0A3D9SHE9_9BACL|nr:protein kinase [Paenibacillus taihuensis]REE91725.1 serine/threonine-protein kinase [Paenibacillus taihuensis]